MEPASAVFEAELVEQGEPGLGTTVAAHLRGEEPTTVELIVRRKDDGEELLRTPADLGSPAALLKTVQDDLLHMSVEEFVAEWKMPDKI
jgi:hypothetical protein